MASVVPPDVPIDSPAPLGAAVQHGHWRKRADLSSGLASVERFLETAGFDRAPWLVVAFASGIAAWFALPGPGEWLALIGTGLAIACGSLFMLGREGRYPYLRQASFFVALAVVAGCGVVWGKSALVGTGAIARPLVTTLEGRLLERVDQPAQQRVRLLLATREPGTGRAIKVRVNLDSEADRPELAEGALLRMRVRLVPPAAPMLPGGYDFARTAWFQGIAATGSVLGKVDVIEAGDGGDRLAGMQRSLSQHVRSRLDGSAGTIAAAFASGDRGAIAEADEEAMRNSGLTHLLSISGLHVSAVIAAAYFLAMKLLAAWPWLALRVRVPLLAASCGALTGIGYTLLTGAEVPTIRSCVAALLVLGAMAIGREPLSLRMVAVAALLVLLLWPEALVGPSFQMSFAAVIAIVALHGAEPLRRFTAPREEPWWWARGLRQAGMLLLTGIVIELALMPIGLFHFHRAGAYGALANVIAIPLTTFISMPLIALALVADIVGAGAPVWWLVGLSLDGLLALAHWTASMPGAVTTLPSMGRGAFALFVAGGLWLALWQGSVRLWGLVPAAIGLVLLGGGRAPDVLVSGDGRHVGITGAGEELLVLRETRSSFARDNLTELAGMAGEARALADWPGARCNADFCAVSLERGGRTWHFLIARGRDMVEVRALAAACERVDVVIADRRLPASCRPRWIKADRATLDRTGGLAFDLGGPALRTVAQEQGAHGWWRPAVRPPRRDGPKRSPPPAPQ